MVDSEADSRREAGARPHRSGLVGVVGSALTCLVLTGEGGGLSCCRLVRLDAGEDGGLFLFLTEEGGVVLLIGEEGVMLLTGDEGGLLLTGDEGGLFITDDEGVVGEGGSLILVGEGGGSLELASAVSVQT